MKAPFLQYHFLASTVQVINTKNTFFECHVRAYECIHLWYLVNYEVGTLVPIDTRYTPHPAHNQGDLLARSASNPIIRSMRSIVTELYIIKQLSKDNNLLVELPF